MTAFVTLVETIPDLATVERNPDWTIRRPALPCAGIFDGSETAEDQDSRDMLVRMNVAVELLTIKPTLTEALSDLNDLLGKLRAAIGASQTLGGVVQRVRYAGCDEPQPVDLAASPCEATLEVQFEVERFESHDSPYA